MQAIFLFTMCVLSSTSRLSPDAREFIPGASAHKKKASPPQRARRRGRRARFETGSQSTTYTVNNMNGVVFKAPTEKAMRSEVAARFPDTCFYKHYLEQTGANEFSIVKNVRNRIDFDANYGQNVVVTISEDSLHVLSRKGSLSKIENRILWVDGRAFNILNESIPIFIEYGNDPYVLHNAVVHLSDPFVFLLYSNAKKESERLDLVAIYSIEEENSIRFDEWDSQSIATFGACFEDIDNDQIVSTRFIFFE